MTPKRQGQKRRDHAERTRSRVAARPLKPAGRTASWMVELLGSAWMDARRLFARIPQTAHAHAVTATWLRALEGFSGRKSRGRILDRAYERVPGQAFYKVRLADDAYGDDDLCVFFAALPASPVDSCSGKAGRVLILGFCWWTQDDEDRYVSRARRRYEYYVRKRR